MKNAGIRYDTLTLDWMPTSLIDCFLSEDKRRGIYGHAGRSFVPKEYLRDYDEQNTA